MTQVEVPRTMGKPRLAKGTYARSRAHVVQIEAAQETWLCSPPSRFPQVCCSAPIRQALGPRGAWPKWPSPCARPEVRGPCGRRVARGPSGPAQVPCRGACMITCCSSRATRSLGVASGSLATQVCVSLSLLSATLNTQKLLQTFEPCP